MGRGDEKDVMTFLSMIDCQSDVVNVCGGGKGPDSYLVKMIYSFLDFDGRSRVCISSDQENAATAVAVQVKQFRTEETFIEASPRYSSASLGKV